MSDVFSLYPHAPAPQSVKSPLETAGEAVNIGRGLSAMKLQQLELQINKLGQLRQTLGGLLADRNVNADDVHRAIVNGVASGLFDPNQASQALSDLAKTPDVRQFLLTHQVQAMDAYKQAAALYGEHVAAQTGDILQYRTTGSALPGGEQGHPTSPPIKIGQSPEFRGTPRTIVQPDGSTIEAPQAAVGGTNVYGEAKPTNARLTGLPVGEPEKFGASQKEYSADLATAGNLDQNLNPLLRAKEISDRLSATNQGPTAAELSTWQQVLTSLGIRKPLPNDSASAVKEMQKYLNQAARGEVGNTNMTDYQREQIAASNPDISQGKAAIGSLLANIIGVRKMNAAMVNDYRKTGGLAQGYSGYKAAHQEDYDPLVFAYPHMPPDQQEQVREMIINQGPAAVARFQNQILKRNKVSPGGPPQASPTPVETDDASSQ